MGKSFLEIKGGDIEGQIAFNKKQTPEITPKLEEDASDGGTNIVLFCLRYSTTDGRFNLKEHQIVSIKMFGSRYRCLFSCLFFRVRGTTSSHR